MLLIPGAPTPIGDYLLPLLQTAGLTPAIVSRQSASTGVHLQLNLNHLEPELSLPHQHLIHLAPLPLILPLLPHLPQLKRLIAFSSTSRFTKINSLDAKERDLAASLARAEEQLIEICAGRGIAWTLFRPTLIYCWGKDKNISFIARFIRRFGFFPVLGEGKGLRQPVHAEDLAQACLQALHNPKTYQQAYNLSGGEILNYTAMVESIFHALGKKPRIIHFPPRLLQAALAVSGWLPPLRRVSPSMLERMNENLCFDHSAARRDFSYQPRRFLTTDEHKGYKHKKNSSPL